MLKRTVRSKHSDILTVIFTFYVFNERVHLLVKIILIYVYIIIIINILPVLIRYLRSEFCRLYTVACSLLNPPRRDSDETCAQNSCTEKLQEHKKIL